LWIIEEAKKQGCPLILKNAQLYSSKVLETVFNHVLAEPKSAQQGFCVYFINGSPNGPDRLISWASPALLSRCAYLVR